MKLTELEPHWVGLGVGHAIGITFLCPHCRQIRVGVLFDVPIGGELLDTYIGMRVIGQHVDGKQWHREGDTFETLTLTPSIDTQTEHGHWHGNITNGEIT